MLTAGKATMDKLSVIWECTAAQLDSISAFFRQAATQTSSLVVTAIFQERWDAHNEPPVARIRALCKFVSNVNTRLTEMELALKRQTASSYESSQGLLVDAGPSLPFDLHASVILPKTASTPPFTTTLETGLGTLFGTATHFRHTRLTPSSSHQTPIDLLAPQGS